VFPTEGVVATVVVEADHVRSGAVAAGIASLRAKVNASKASCPERSHLQQGRDRRPDQRPDPRERQRRPVDARSQCATR
jgi:hypothetical protein